MKKLVAKLDDAKKEYELNKTQKVKRYTEILESISLTDRVVLRTYTFQKCTVNLFQKNINLSKLREKYHILHDENDSNYFSVFEKHDVRESFVTVMHMYILIPKYDKTTPLCLFIKRYSGKKITFRSYNKESSLPILYCFPNLYCENSVCAYISEYNFEEELNCDFQAIHLHNKFNCKLEMKKNNYLKVIKKHIIENYLNKTFTFKIYKNDSFRKYVECPEKYTMEGFDKLLPSFFKSIYEKFKNGENGFETSTIIDKYEIKCKVYNGIQKGDVRILDESKKTGKSLGHLEMNIEILLVKAEIYEDGILVNERLISLREEKTFEAKLSDYVKDFSVY